MFAASYFGASRRAALLFLITAAFSLAAETSAPLINLRDHGAIGDGNLHYVSEWITSGRFKNLRGIQKRYPFVDTLRWTVDEVAFEAAKLALPPSGGSIEFPAGHYVAGRHGWRIWRDHVRLLGQGSAKTILSTAPDVPEALILSPYRHVGWLEGAAREYPYAAESGARGDTTLMLSQKEWLQEFQPGERVFLRNGANRFDQDYGEFNEIDSISESGGLRFKYPFARDYTQSRFNWASELAEDFKVPQQGATVSVRLKTGEGFFSPKAGNTVTVGPAIFRVEEASAQAVVLSNRGRVNPPPGTVIAAGTKLGKSRSVIKVTRTTYDTRIENLQIVGRRKVLNLSNSYQSVFLNCVFKRDARGSSFSGGLTIDGDGGRFARFERCTVIAEPAAGMQFARSFGSVAFDDCRFENANVAFTEFNFDCRVVNSTFDVAGTAQLTNVIVAGKSCGDLQFIGNRIRATGVATIFDTYSDIHSQKHGSEGDVLVRANRIETNAGVRVFTFPRAAHVHLEGNEVIEISKP